jgi:hypothetical protein
MRSKEAAKNKNNLKIKNNEKPFSFCCCSWQQVAPPPALLKKRLPVRPLVLCFTRAKMNPPHPM